VRYLTKFFTSFEFGGETHCCTEVQEQQHNSIR